MTPEQQQLFQMLQQSRQPPVDPQRQELQKATNVGMGVAGTAAAISPIAGAVKEAVGLPGTKAPSKYPIYSDIMTKIQQPLKEYDVKQENQKAIEAKKRFDPSARDFAFKLKTKFDADQRIKATREIDMATNRMQSAYQNYLKDPNKGANALDQALITLYNKVNDPGSVVRESEFNRFAEGLSLGSFFKGKGGKWLYGGSGLTDPDRAQLVKYAAVLAQGQMSAYQEAFQEYKHYSDTYGIPMELIIGSQRKTVDPKSINTSVELSEEDKKYLDWAKENPDDPRAQRILDLNRR